MSMSHYYPEQIKRNAIRTKLLRPLDSQPEPHKDQSSTKRVE